MKHLTKNNLKKVAVALLCVCVLSGCGAQVKDDMTKHDTKTSASKKGDHPNQAMASEDSLKNEATLGEFTLLNTEGKEVKWSDYRGKKVYLKLWASWCPVCLTTLEDTEALSVKKDKGYEVVSVVAPNFQNEKSSEDFSTWYRGLDYKKLTVLLDENGEHIAKKIGVRGYPTSVFVDSNGVINSVVPGVMDEASIDKMMASLK